MGSAKQFIDYMPALIWYTYMHVAMHVQFILPD